MNLVLLTLTFIFPTPFLNPDTIRIAFIDYSAYKCNSEKGI